MTWRTNRAARLPSNWEALRKQVKARANGQCQWIEKGQRCAELGAECDHIIAGDNHDLNNLQWLCKAHHHKKTLSEAAEARKKRSRYRPEPKHPGLR